MAATPNSLPASPTLTTSSAPAESPLALSELGERFGERGRGKGAHLHLVRYCFQRDRILSFLIIPDLPGSAARVLPCIENRRYTFPDGRYRLRLTQSKRFNRPMPLIDEVPATPEFPSYDGRTCGYRTGMRIHLARTPEPRLHRTQLRQWRWSLTRPAQGRT